MSHPTRPDARLKRRRARRGVVMLDAILALAIIALAALVLVPIPHGGIAGTEVRAEAIKIAAEFRQGRAAAVRGRKPVDVFVDPSARVVGYEGSTPVKIRDGIRITWTTSDQCPERGGLSALRYLADGRSCGAVLKLSAGVDYQLRIDWLTGRVEMSVI